MNRYKRQVGLTAGTVFHWTKLPLTVWFLAIYHLRKQGRKESASWRAPRRAAADRRAVKTSDGGDGGARGGEAQGRGRRSGDPYLGRHRAAAIEAALAGDLPSVAAPDHAERYLTGFAWRFNRRYQLDTLTERLAYACARTAPIRTGSSSPDE